MKQYSELNIFLATLCHYGRMTSEAEQEILSRITIVHRPKGYEIIRKGQVVSSFFIVKQGMVRAYYKKGSAEITSWFAYEGQIAVSLAALSTGKPSYETVECIEDCELLSISNNDLQSLYQKHECLNTIGRKMAEEYCVILDDRTYQLQVMSAVERYKDLMEYEPEIIRRAQLSNIASFLGISQETLSRIRHQW